MVRGDASCAELGSGAVPGGVIVDRVSLQERFLRYVAVDTQSDAASSSVPSSAGQLRLGRLLVAELRALGVEEVEQDEGGCVMARLPGRGCAADSPRVGLIAHLDTAPDAPGSPVRPRIVRAYDGGPIALGERGVRVIDPAVFPELLNYKGQDIIVTDGETLLGADDKAGVAAIMEALRYLMLHPEVAHPPLRIGFTCDEEIGRGADHFDISRFDADFAYTVDGGAVGELQYENFNACEAQVIVEGESVHPGEAKGKLRNALTLAREYDAMLPQLERPEYTSGREGFFHLVGVHGDVSRAEMHYIVRDHDGEAFLHRTELLQSVAAGLNAREGAERVRVVITDQYRNMLSVLQSRMDIVRVAREAIVKSGLKPREEPIRGGTDGARLSEMGLPCPNLFAGGHNFHGEYEYLPVESLVKAAEVVVRLCAQCAAGGLTWRG